MNLYAESSAVLAWLLDETAAGDVVGPLSQADVVFSSELTLVECDRAFLRVTHLGELTEAEADRRRDRLIASAAHWTLLAPSEEVTARARRAFPAEPVRTLDALHLATALLTRSAVPDVSILALDDRIRTNAEALGFAVVP